MSDMHNYTVTVLHGSAIILSQARIAAFNPIDAARRFAEANERAFAKLSGGPREWIIKVTQP